MTYSPNEATATEIKAQIMFVTKLFKVQQHTKLFFLVFPFVIDVLIGTLLLT